MEEEEEEEKFTIQEIANYIVSRDSLGDVLYYLRAENIRAANEDNADSEDDEGNYIN